MRGESSIEDVRFIGSLPGACLLHQVQPGKARQGCEGVTVVSSSREFPYDLSLLALHLGDVCWRTNPQVDSWSITYGLSLYRSLASLKRRLYPVALILSESWKSQCLLPPLPFHSAQARYQRSLTLC